MKKRDFRKISILCALTVSTILAAGCTKTEHTVGISTEKAGFYQDKQNSAESGNGENTNENSAGYAALPDGNFEGYTFTMVRWTEENALVPETETGDSLHDAAYRRSRDVEKKYNIVLSESVLPSADIADEMEKSNRSQSFFCDAAYVSSTEAGGLALGGYLYDLSALPYMNLSREWWEADAMKGLSMIVRQYFGISAASVEDENASGTAWYNRDAYAAAGLPDIQYQVNSGKWTIDTMLTMKKTANSSVNGGDSAPLMLFGGAGGSFIARNSADCPKSFGGDYAEKVSARIAGLWNDGVFGEENALFGIGTLADAAQLSGNYGLLPLPKYTESQSQYYSTIDLTQIGLLTVPKNTAATNRTGAVLEALACYSLPTVVSEYRESWGEMADASMLKQILDGRSADLALIYDFGGIPSTYSASIAAGKTLADMLIDPAGTDISANISGQIADMQSKLSALTKK